MYIGTPKFTNDGIKTSSASTMYLVLEYMFIFKLDGKNISIQNSSNEVTLTLDVKEGYLESFCQNIVKNHVFNV